MTFVYVIKSTLKNFRYVGIADDIKDRLKRHDAGRSLSTKPYKPFKLVYTESFPNKKLARIREKFFKSGAGRKFLDSLES